MNILLRHTLQGGAVGTIECAEVLIANWVFAFLSLTGVPDISLHRTALRLLLRPRVLAILLFLLNLLLIVLFFLFFLFIV